MEKQKVKDEIAARFSKKNWLGESASNCILRYRCTSYDRSTRVCG